MAQLASDSRSVARQVRNSVLGYVEVDSATALARFRDALTHDEVRIDRLVAASRSEPPAVRERLRAILRHAGYKEHSEQISAARDPRTRARALRVIDLPA